MESKREKCIRSSAKEIIFEVIKTYKDEFNTKSLKISVKFY